MKLSGRLFLPNSSEYRQAFLLLDAQGYMQLLDDEFSCRAHLSDVQVSTPMGNQPRRFKLPNRALFVAEHSSELSEWLKEAGQSQLVNTLERSWPMIIGALLFTAFFVTWLYFYGLSLSARWIAGQLPVEVAETLGKHTLAQMDEMGFEPSKLS